MTETASAPDGSWRGTGSDAIRSLVRLAPPPAPRWGVALRSGLALAIPLAVFTLLGQPGFGLQAATGTFTVIFLSALPAKERAKGLPLVAAVLFACAALGVALTPWLWAFVAGLVGLTLAVCALAFAYRLGPPGPVFFVLTYGLSANITAVVDGERRVDPWLFLALMAAGSLFAYVVSLAPIVLRRERLTRARPLREILPGPWIGPGERVLLTRIAVVAVVGATFSLLWLDPARVYWTVATGVTVVGLVAVRGVSVTRGLHRTVGTVFGALLFLLIAPLGEYQVLLIVVLFLLQFAIEFFVVRNYALALVFITPLVLFINSAASGTGDVGAVATERVLDTVVGSILGMLAVLIRGRTKVDPAETP